ncbi:hypothetical protein C8Q80DRAFT_904636 [Daedaleopsis nitida]|nr:hypothetical protein C8Q80DRAFT_904636 [Daedaleopsis nitida]
MALVLTPRLAALCALLLLAVSGEAQSSPAITTTASAPVSVPTTVVATDPASTVSASLSIPSASAPSSSLLSTLSSLLSTLSSLSSAESTVVSSTLSSVTASSSVLSVPTSTVTASVSSVSASTVTASASLSTGTGPPIETYHLVTSYISDLVSLPSLGGPSRCICAEFRPSSRWAGRVDLAWPSKIHAPSSSCFEEVERAS